MQLQHVQKTGKWSGKSLGIQSSFNIPLSQASVGGGKRHKNSSVTKTGGFENASARKDRPKCDISSGERWAVSCEASRNKVVGKRKQNVLFPPPYALVIDKLPMTINKCR